MTKIRVKFRPSSVKGHPGSLVYLVTKNKVTKQMTTNYKVFSSDWDSEKFAIIPSDDRTQVISKNIDLDLELFNEIIRSLDGNNQDYKSEDVISQFLCTNREHSLFSFMESLITRLGQLGHIRTADNYSYVLRRFKKFLSGKDIMLERIDKTLIEDYEAWLKVRNLSPNTTSFHMRILRAVYNRAVDLGLTKEMKPFKTVFKGMEKTSKRAISLEDVKKIKYLDLSLKPRLEFARDMFIFLFMCRGMSFIDAAYLKKTDIYGDVLTYRRHKTGQIIRIKIEKPIKNIINRYSVKDSPYLLPIIRYFLDEGRFQYNAAIHKINKALKKVGEMVPLKIPLTTYVSRHSWATIAKRNKVPIAVISEALGHDSEKTTQIYLDSMDSADIDKANNQIIKGL